MVLSRVLSRFPRSLLSQGRNALFSRPQHPFSSFSSHYHSSRLLVGSQTSLLNHRTLNTSIFQRFGFSSSSPQPGTSVEDNSSENAKPIGDPDETGEINSGDAEVSDQTKEAGSDPKSGSARKRRRSGKTKSAAFSDSDSEDELSVDDLVKLVKEKEELLKTKQEEINSMKDKVLRTYAEMENIMDRTKREAENSKKFAVQSFAKGLLDVADNLERAFSVVKVSYSKIDASKDTAGAVPLLKTLLEGVEMTDKQLGEVFRKFGVEKFDPANEQFDPHRHNAAFQISDPSKPPGTVAAVLKPGYLLYDRVIRPAEVGVNKEVESDEAN